MTAALVERQRIVILGGGTAGWMTAAALSKYLPAARFSIQVIESTQIGTVGVGEATIPHIRQFNQWIGLDETEFIRAVGATYKLAIRFSGWGEAEADYYHPFGLSGEDLNGLPFHQYWLWLRQHQQSDLKAFGDYSLAVLMAQNNRFRYPSADPREACSAFNYAFHMDATLYAQLLRRHCLARGVQWLDARVAAVHQHASGDIRALQLEDGRQLAGDLFIDCTGFAGVLIEQTLRAGYDNWQHWLPCDRALAVPSQPDPTPPVYTHALATAAGWQWRIPLQHRTGNGLVYASAYLDDAQASELLLAGLQEQALDEPRPLRFVTGRRRQSWLKNCVAIGLSSGFLEPLESTSLYLIQVAIQQLLACFPGDTVSEVERDHFNRSMELEYQRVRDFLILHYKLNHRPELFWRHCATMPIPDSLAQRLVMYRETGHLLEYRQGLFQPASWLAVMLGQGCYPERLDARLDNQRPDAVAEWLTGYQQQLQSLTHQMPLHSQALQSNQHPGSQPPAVQSLYGYRSRP
ncbi:tryptophan halogenase family protein [Bowmanella dokdonensis]|uniref:Tryptophan 7-halogenase n=1 Tax=Bowmanella dokdonensis TaxID=751969 RepID=A0A939IRM2_9ALTE|nr:tryptophan halogenase family protein [Bowmanella dokdonensis]MBN7825646.1 tryptophan 7-halogenase [Bowmanella dokdonensis]